MSYSVEVSLSFAFVTISPVWKVFLLIFFLKVELSDTISAMMSCAP